MTWTNNHLIISLTAVSVIPALTTRLSNGQEDNFRDLPPWPVMIFGGVDSSSEGHLTSGRLDYFPLRANVVKSFCYLNPLYVAEMTEVLRIGPIRKPKILRFRI